MDFGTFVIILCWFSTFEIITCQICTFYSVVGLVCPRGEEQISTSVAGRQPPGEEVGMAARFQPPTKVVVAQFQTFLATPGTFLSTF